MLADRIRLGRRAARAALPVSQAEFAQLLVQSKWGGGGRTRAGVTLGPQRALGITAWYSGARYLSETVASLPVHYYRQTLDGPRERRADPVWLERPDVETPTFGLLEEWMMALLHRGNAYAFKVRNGSGQVSGLRPIHPDRVRVGQAADGTKVFEIDGRRDIGYTTREILHVPGLSYNGVVGLDPITVHAESLGTVSAADEYAGRFFGQGSHVRGYVSVPGVLTDPEAEELRAQWERFHRGITSAHEFGVLGNGAEYRTIGLDPQQTQLIQTRQYGVTEVSRILRVPPHKLYDLSHATFSNIEHQSIEAVVDSIRPWVERFEAWLNFDRDLVLAGYYVRFEVDELLRGDSVARAEFYSKATGGSAWMAGNEARHRENLPPVDGLDDLLVPLNMRAAGTPATFTEKVNAAGALVRAGYDPAQALAAVGLPPIRHTGALPVTVQSEA